MALAVWQSEVLDYLTVVLSFDSSSLDVFESTGLVVLSLHCCSRHCSINSIIQKHPTSIKLVESSDLSSILSTTVQRHLSIVFGDGSTFQWTRWYAIPLIFPAMAMRLDNVSRA